MPATPATVLESAKQLLLTDGWITGDLHCDGKYCALGAVRAVCGNPDLAPDGRVWAQRYRRAVDALATAMEPTWPQRFKEQEQTGEYYVTLLDAAETAITDYNDGRVETRQGRDAVVRRFDKAIASLS